jgi:CRP-like cAMP-binding protein
LIRVNRFHPEWICNETPMNRLREISLFASLDDETLAELDAITRQRRYRKGEILFFEGEAPSALVILTKGVLKLYKTSAMHKEVVLHRFTPVSLIAEAALLHRTPYPASSVFETDGEVVLIDAEAFDAVFLGNPKLSKLLILSLGTKIKMLESLIERSLIMDAGERVLSLVENSPELFKTMRHYELANSLNITPETFSRMIRKLLREGKIRKENGGYVAAEKRGEGDDLSG